MSEPKHTPNFPAEPAHVLVPGPAGSLEVAVDHPVEDDLRDPVVALICAGSAEDTVSFHNKVVQIMERSYRELGAITVRVHFRGCGESEGGFAEGFGETEDLLAVHQWVKAALPSHEVWLGGYRFGAYVAQRACEKLRPGHLVTISPPLDSHDFPALPEPACPWLVVGAELDETTSPEKVNNWLGTIATDPRLVLMEEADSEFHRRLMDLRGVLKNGIRRGRGTTDD